ncbi:MAG: hypothetical protein HRT74_07615 [Flavobacteriales bacterium]|nr:hypothetical protein [Flavobacteriales bacterium]
MKRLEQLQELLKEDPNDSFLRYALALEFRSAGDDRSKEQLLSLIKDDGEYLPSFQTLGSWFFDDGEDDKAIEVLEKGIELAEKQRNLKALNEMKELLWLNSDED